VADEAAEVAPGKAATPEQQATDVRSRPTDATLELELVSSTDGAPITNGVVELIITPHTSAGIDATERIVQARTDPGGALRMPLEPCALRIVAWSERASTRAFVELHEGETLFKRLVLIPTRAFRGCVVDALMGEPIPDAEVRIWTHSETDLVLTGPDGVITADGVHTAFPKIADARAALASHSAPIILGQFWSQNIFVKKRPRNHLKRAQNDPQMIPTRTQRSTHGPSLREEKK
jgi:hypothetical protein